MDFELFDNTVTQYIGVAGWNKRHVWFNIYQNLLSTLSREDLESIFGWGDKFPIATRKELIKTIRKLGYNRVSQISGKNMGNSMIVILEQSYGVRGFFLARCREHISNKQGESWR